VAKSRPETCQKYTVDVAGTIRDVVENLNTTMLRVAFVTEEERVVGSVSDGDIRRAFLQGRTIESPIAEIMNRTFISAQQDSSPSELQQLFRRGIDVLPVLGDKGQLVDIRRQGANSEIIPVAEPALTNYERDLVLEAIDSGWVSSIGQFVNDFEMEFCEYVGATEAVSVNNGTSALSLALWALGVGPGDEVLVPDLTFGATANAVVQCGATPVLVDIAPDTWALNPNLLDAVLSSKTRAIIVVHLYGIPAQLDAIVAFAKTHGLFVIEDCAEALGTEYQGDHVGSTTDAGTFSFFGNKTITTGEGGMVTFKSRHHATRARTIRSHGMSSERRYWHEEWGTNLRLTNLQAALGLGQLRRIDDIVNRKRSLAELYTSKLSDLLSSGLELAPEPDAGSSTVWLFTVLLPLGIDPGRVSQRMLREGVETRRVFNPLHIQPAFSQFKLADESYDASTFVADRGLSLPSSINLTNKSIDFVAETLLRTIQEIELN